MPRLDLLPNALTILRLVAGILFPLAPAGWRLPLVLFGGLSDLFDGWLSRRWGSTSDFGQLLDPVADKVFVLAVAGTVVSEGRLTPLELCGVAARDVVVLALTAYAATRVRLTPAALRPRWAGKVATAGQCVLLTACLYFERRLPLLTAVVIGLSLAAAVDYAVYAVRQLQSVGTDLPSAGGTPAAEAPPPDQPGSGDGETV